MARANARTSEDRHVVSCGGLSDGGASTAAPAALLSSVRPAQPERGKGSSSIRRQKGIGRAASYVRPWRAAPKRIEPLEVRVFVTQKPPVPLQ
jgi:hypothetical protein